MDRCPNSRPPGSEIRKLFQESLVDVYQPFGEAGAEVDLLSSIALVNRCEWQCFIESNDNYTKLTVIS